MKVVIVYESMYGNTHHVANTIGAGLRGVADVAVVPVEQASEELVDTADLLVVGGPTHVHGMSRPSTRKAAVEALAKNEALELDPEAEGRRPAHLDPEPLGSRRTRRRVRHAHARVAGAHRARIEGHRASAHEARLRADRSAGKLHRDEDERARARRTCSRAGLGVAPRELHPAGR